LQLLLSLLVTIQAFLALDSPQQLQNFTFLNFFHR
jgi:hypothetical protein